jgi:UDP-glucose 4-epimerase
MSGEGLSLAYAKTYELPVSTFRFFNIYGPWQRPEHEYAAVIPKWISKCMKGEEIDIFGDGEQTRDFTYVGTVVNVIIDCILNKILHPEPVNLAYGNNISLNQVTELLRNSFPDLKVKKLSPRAGDVLHSKNDPKLIKALYPSVDIEKFETSLEKTINWFKKSKT